MPQNTTENKENKSALASKPETWRKAWMASPGPVKFSEHANLFLKGVFNLEPKEFKKIGEEYISMMKNISNNSFMTTDKLPINFTSIGLIKLILPKSKIIHCYRNPMDNIFSIYKNHFPGGKINFAYDLNEIVEFYKLYRDLMKHWNNILPDFIFNLKYENLVNNTEKEISEMLNFCNLEWENACLEFYTNKRPIKTTSDTQVRKKIYSSSINSWLRIHFI